MTCFKPKIEISCTFTDASENFLINGLRKGFFLFFALYLHPRFPARCSLTNFKSNITIPTIYNGINNQGLKYLSQLSKDGNFAHIKDIKESKEHQQQRKKVNIQTFKNQVVVSVTLYFYSLHFAFVSFEKDFKFLCDDIRCYPLEIAFCQYLWCVASFVCLPQLLDSWGILSRFTPFFHYFMWCEFVRLFYSFQRGVISFVKDLQIAI